MTDPFNLNPPPIDPNEIPIDQMDGNLLHNLVLFGRIVRALGVDVNPGRIMEVTHALGHIELWRKADFYNTLRSMIITRREDIPKFDEAFELFWKKPHDGTIDATLADLLADGLGWPEEDDDEMMVAPPPLEDDSEDEEDCLLYTSPSPRDS